MTDEIDENEDRLIVKFKNGDEIVYTFDENDEMMEADYKGQDVKVASYNSVFLNTPTTFEFTKTDISKRQVRNKLITLFISILLNSCPPDSRRRSNRYCR